MELMQWLFASIDEIIDCDYINNQEEKTDGSNKGKRPSQVVNDSGKSKCDDP